MVNSCSANNQLSMHERFPTVFILRDYCVQNLQKMWKIYTLFSLYCVYEGDKFCMCWKLFNVLVSLGVMKMIRVKECTMEIAHLRWSNAAVLPFLSFYSIVCCWDLCMLSNLPLIERKEQIIYRCTCHFRTLYFLPLGRLWSKDCFPLWLKMIFPLSVVQMTRLYHGW